MGDKVWGKDEFLNGYKPLDFNEYAFEGSGVTVRSGRTGAQINFGGDVMLYVCERRSKDAIAKDIEYDIGDFEPVDGLGWGWNRDVESDGVVTYDGMIFPAYYNVIGPGGVEQQAAADICSMMEIDDTSLSSADHRLFSARLMTKYPANRVAHWDCIDCATPEMAVENAIVQFHSMVSENVPKGSDYETAAKALNYEMVTKALDKATEMIQTRRSKFENKMAFSERRLPDVTIPEADLTKEKTDNEMQFM